MEEHAGGEVRPLAAFAGQAMAISTMGAEDPRPRRDVSRRGVWILDVLRQGRGGDEPYDREERERCHAGDIIHEP